MKPSIFFVSLSISAWGQLTPSAPTIVRQGQTQSITSAVPVTWSLATGSAGTLSTVDSTHATYTAPASVPTRNVYGCAMPPDHVYNTQIDSLSVNASNAAYLGSLTSRSVRFVFSVDFPSNTATTSTPTVTMVGNYSANTITGVPMLPLSTREMENGVYMTGGDHHYVVTQRDSCTAYEMYQIYPAGHNPDCPLCTTASITSYPYLSAALPIVGVDAAGMSVQALTLRASDVRFGLKHALRFSISNAYLNMSSVWPATAYAYRAFGTIPYGTRFRLRSTFDVASFCATKSVPSMCTNLLTGLARYGAYAVDGADDPTIVDFSGDGDIAYDPEVAKTIGEVTSQITVTAANWEAVDESSLRDTTSDASLPALVTPALGSGATVVVATALSGGTVSKLRIVNQGGAIGFDAHKGYQYMQGGASTTFAANVTGLSASTVTWSMSPSVGTLNASTGAYTAPSVSSITTTTITATSTVDGTVSGSFVLSVFPSGSLYVTLRTPDYTDTGGQKWYSRYLHPWFSYIGGDSYGKTINNTTGYDWNALQYSGNVGGDLIFRAILAPGSYLAQPILYRTDYDTPPGKLVMLETPDQIVARSVDQAITTVGAQITPLSAKYPVQVGSDNAFQFNLRKIVDSATLGGFVISADPGSSRLLIDNPNAGANIVPGQSFTVGCVAAGGLGVGCTFAITSGLNSGLVTVDSTTATYTAPLPPPTSPQTLTITATSTADGTKTATTTFVRVFGTLGVTGPYSPISRQLSETFAANLSGTPYSNVSWSASAGSMNSSTGTWTAPNVSSDTPVTITATSLDDGTQTANMTVTVKTAAAPMYVNLGDLSTNTTDTAGRVWVPSAYVSTYHPHGQSVVTTCVGGGCGLGNNGVTISGVADALQQPLYKSAGYAHYADSITTTFTLPRGTYKVTGKFADYDCGPARDMTQDITINGTAWLTNFNLNAGGSCKASDQTSTVTITGTTLSIYAVRVGASEQSQTNAISVEPIGGAPPPASSRVLRGVTVHGKIR